MRKIIFLAALVIACSAEAAGVAPVLGGGLEFGGEPLVRAEYSDGSTSQVNAGNGILVQAGAVAEIACFGAHCVDLQSTFGLKWTGTKEAKNGEVSWIRFPLELIAFYRPVSLPFRAGPGVSYQFGNSVSGSKDAAPLTTAFQSALGFVVQADYLFGARKNVPVGLRYTRMQYRTASGYGPVQGDSIGISVQYLWN